MMTQRLHRSFLITLICLLSLTQTAQADPPEYQATITADGFPGVKTDIHARFRAPLEEVITEILDIESHVGRYPKMERSFCLTEEQAQQAKKLGLRNAATVQRLFYKHRCHPLNERKPGQDWSFYWFQEFDYPFPLTNRWVISRVCVQEDNNPEKRFELDSHLVYGRQDIYNFRLRLRSYPKIANQTQAELFVWTDPGGFIPDSLLKKATKGASKQYMRVMERGSRNRVPKQTQARGK